MNYRSLFETLESEGLSVTPSDWLTRDRRNPMPYSITGKGKMYNFTAVYSRDFLNREAPQSVIDTVFRIFNIS